MEEEKVYRSRLMWPRYLKPPPPTPSPSKGSQDPEADDTLAARLKELEGWRERVNTVQRFQGESQPNNLLERAARLVLSSVAKEKPFDPFA